MAALAFSAACSHDSKSVSRSILNSSFIDRNSKLFCIRTPRLNLARRIFSIKNFASDQKHKVQEPKTDEQASLDTFVPDSGTIASSIKYHAEFTPSFSPENFELRKAFYATAESVRDMLIINWNATYNYHEKMNVKQADYLSMEYLQGRALLNAIGNLELTGPYAEAFRKLG